jgi:hypothetical protein
MMDTGPQNAVILSNDVLLNLLEARLTCTKMTKQTKHSRTNVYKQLLSLIGPEPMSNQHSAHRPIEFAFPTL